MRSLGATCHNIHTIDLSNLKSISDIGVRSLAMGCPKLKKINMQGMYLLSDQKYSAQAQSGPSGAVTNKFKAMKIKISSTMNASTSSTNINSSKEPIGLAAIKYYAPNIEDLNVSGCFRLNMSIQHQLSGLKNLRISKVIKILN